MSKFRSSTAILSNLLRNLRGESAGGQEGGEPDPPVISLATDEKGNDRIACFIEVPII